MLVTLPDVLIALVVLLVLSASMSTLASLVLTSSSTMTLDLIYRDKKSLPGEVEEGSIDDVVAERVERRKGGQSHQPHQLRRYRNGRRFPRRMACQSVHTQDEQRGGETYFRVLSVMKKILF